ncbi:hypothetical protein MGH68_10335 [Erysipelothrix sp. D19-032]
MTEIQTLRFVILPQALRNALPAIGNEFVVNIKDSSVLNVILVASFSSKGTESPEFTTVKWNHSLSYP